MRIVITGIGFRSALGDLAGTWHNLMVGRSGIKLSQPFLDLAPLPLALIDTAPIEVIALTREVVAEAVKDAQLSLPLPNCGVALGSSRACQAQWERFVTNRQDLSGWLAALPHSPAIAAARYIGSHSALLAPMAACATGIVSLAQGIELIRSGACELAIAGAVEAPITRLTITGFRQMGALATSGCYPFDRSRDGLVLGEAGAVFVLESARLAQARGARIYGEVLGCGLTNDAYHLCAADLNLGAAISAIDRSFANYSSTDIDYVHAHGTGTILNDRRESQLIERMFPQGVPISSTKGATGHTLGSSGAVGIALCLQSIATQILPPCVGLTQPEFNLDFAIAPRQTIVDRVLCLSFGFGGQNAAILLQKWTGEL